MDSVLCSKDSGGNMKKQFWKVLYDTAVTFYSNVAFACLYAHGMDGGVMAGIPVAVGAAAGFFGLTMGKALKGKSEAEQKERLIEYLAAKARLADEEVKEYYWVNLQEVFDERMGFLNQVVSFNNATLGVIRDEQDRQAEQLEAIQGCVAKMLDEQPKILDGIIAYIGENREAFEEMLDEQTEELAGHITGESDRVIETVIEAVKKYFGDLALAPGDIVSGLGVIVKDRGRVGNIGDGGIYVEGDYIKEKHEHHYHNRENPKTDISDRIIQNIPWDSLGDLFKGREEDFNSLKTKLDGAGGAMAITQAIGGLGGIGKTRLAVEYGWYGLQEGLYRAVLFVNCGQEKGKERDQKTMGGDEQEQVRRGARERLMVEMGKLGRADLLEVAGYPLDDPEAAVGAVLKKLGEREKWLVVFDNVDEPEMAAAVREMVTRLASMAGGKVIVTSRLQSLGGTIACLELEKLSERASIEYLPAKTKGKRAERKNDGEQVEELAKVLDGLPVALEQAAAYINYRRIAFEEYLGRYREMADTLLGFDEVLSGLGEDFKPVLTVWALTEQQLGAVARAVMTLAAFLAPEQIPAALFINYPDRVFEAAGILDGEFDEGGYRAKSEVEKADGVEGGAGRTGGV